MASIFTPPFAGLAIIVWFYIVWCFVVHPDTVILRGETYDSDDYMYLVQVIDWLRGQDWFDNIQHRLAPPDGVMIHFSRLTALPLAGLIQVGRWIGLDWVPAATVTMAVWPLMLLGCWLAALRWTAREFMPLKWSGVTAWIALFSGVLLIQFSPGRVDHHGLIAIILTLALGCVLRAVREPKKMQWGIGGGILLALGQLAALEILPCLLILSGWMVLGIVLIGKPFIRQGMGFAIALVVTASVGLVLTHPYSNWWIADVSAYSVVYVALAVGIAACAAVASLTTLILTKPLPRLLATAVTAIGAAVLLVQIFPDIAAGPYGNMDEKLATIMFTYMGEAQPLWKLESSLAAMVLRLLLPMGALAVCVGLTIRSWRERIGDYRFYNEWLLITILLAVAVGLTIFVQARVMRHVMLFSIIPIAAFLYLGLKSYSARWSANTTLPVCRRIVLAQILIITIAGPLPMVILPAVTDSRPFNSGVLLFPVSTVSHRCSMEVLEKILNAPQLYGDRPRLIMNMIDSGSEIMFRTQHSVMAAPYHKNAAGNLEAVSFFSTTVPAEAEAIANKRGVELVAVCRQVSSMYLGKGHSNPKLNDSMVFELPADASFVEQLIYGHTPAWLKRVEHPLLKNYLLFEVVTPTKR